MKWKMMQIREQEDYVLFLKKGIEDLRRGLRVLREEGKGEEEGGEERDRITDL